MQVVYSDLKEAHQAFNLLASKDPINREGLPLEVRLMRYGQLFNERVGIVYHLEDAKRNQELQGELYRE